MVAFHRQFQFGIIPPHDPPFESMIATMGAAPKLFARTDDAPGLGQHAEFAA